MISAWMVRKDGKIIPVVQHIYASFTCVEETLYAAQWLYQYTNSKEIKTIIIAFIRTWAMQKLNCRGNEICNAIIYEIERRPYVFLEKSFVSEHETELMKELPEYLKKYSLENYCREITLTLNEEFMRVRFGGKYHTEAGNKKLYFRISSEDYHWNKAILSFLSETKLDYKEMRVIIDEESAELNPSILKNKQYFYYETEE